LFVSGTAAKYSSGATLPRYLGSPGASCTCAMPFDDSLARGSGRRSRRFKSCHPDQHHRRSAARTRKRAGLVCYQYSSKVRPIQQQQHPFIPAKASATTSAARPARSAPSPIRWARPSRSSFWSAAGLAGGTCRSGRWRRHRPTEWARLRGCAVLDPIRGRAMGNLVRGGPQLGGQCLSVCHLCLEVRDPLLDQVGVRGRSFLKPSRRFRGRRAVGQVVPQLQELAPGPG